MIRYVPLLQKQLELMQLPRGRGRFEEYLRQMVSDDRGNLDLPPLVIMNPMAKEHLREMLEQLIDMDADTIAKRAIAGSEEAIQSSLDGALSLVIADDAAGGWTNRFDYEFKFRFFDPRVKDRRSRCQFTRAGGGWHSVILWSSEPVSEQSIDQAVSAVVFRAEYQRIHGDARTLRDQMRQEGWVLTRAKWKYPDLTNEEVETTRAVIRPHLNANDFRTSVECLFGDVAAASLGFTQRGLDDWAGLRLAQYDAEVSHK